MCPAGQEHCLNETVEFTIKLMIEIFKQSVSFSFKDLLKEIFI